MDVSDFKIRRVADTEDLTPIHALGRDTFLVPLQCTPGTFWPSIEQLTKTREIGGAIYLAAYEGRDVGFATAGPDGQMTWLRAYPWALGFVCAAAAVHIRADFGECWGIMPNADVRAAVHAAAPGQCVELDDAGRVRFEP